MPADITNTRGRDEMMYVGATPWHGLGTELPNVATSAEALEAAGLGWEVVMRPVYFKQAPVHAGGNLIYTEIPNKRVAIRRDTKDTFGVMGTQYTPVQNRDAFQFFDALVGQGEAIYHTAGSLSGGKRVWILAKLPGDLKLAQDDVLQQFILLSNSHDGTSSFRVQFTPVRVVCANTLHVALMSSTRARYKARHTSGVMGKVQEARSILGLAEAYSAMFLRGCERLAEEAFDGAKMGNLALDVLGVGDKARVDLTNGIPLREPAMSSLTTLTNLFYNGRGNSGRSKWDAFNAVTEFVDHKRANGRSLATLGSTSASVVDKRLESAWFGTGAAMKQTAWDRLLEGVDLG